MTELEVVQKKERLWTKDFLFLWQGQLVSTLGDAIYELALGFWILAVTGSTALMGTLIAVSMLPRIVLSPFAGVIVDRTNRKQLLIIADLIRGFFITAVGVAALLGHVQVWMIFVAGIIVGICGAFFSPAISSSIPDIVPKSTLVQANSLFSIATTGSNILGNSFGGFLFQILGAPILFLFNGLSYLFSVLSLFFIKIPKIEHPHVQSHFWVDFKEGLDFVWKFKALKTFILLAAMINFFASIGMVLTLPFFQRSAELGSGKYGIAIALFTGGMMLGMVFTSAYKIPAAKRHFLFILSGFVCFTFFASFPFAKSFVIMLLALVIAGFFNAIINVFFSAVVQLTVPQNMRGKVIGLMGTVMQGLTPIAIAIGGILAEFIEIKFVIFYSFMFCLLSFIPVLFINAAKFKAFINFNPETHKLEEII